MPPFICEFAREMVILSDGNVTTCCIDPLAINAFANIHQESPEEILRKHHTVYNSITNDIESMPRCRICYKKIKESGITKTPTYNSDPSPKEVSDFLQEIASDKIRLVIELSSICNLKCNGCITSREEIKNYREKPFLDVPALVAFLKPNLDRIGTIRLYNYGETFLHPEAISFCTQIKSLAPSIRIDIATNGMLLNSEEKRRRLVRSRVDELYFSIHGGKQESVQKYMTEKFDLDLAISIIEDIQRIKKSLQTDKPKIFWKYLLFAWNDTDAEITAARQLAARLGVSLAFTIPGFPSPSPRFSNNPALYTALCASAQNP